MAGGDAVPEGVDEAVGMALDDVILPRLQLQLPHEEGGGHRLQAVAALGWLARATAMRQHPRLAVPLETALAYLEAASLDLATAEEEAGVGVPGAQSWLSPSSYAPHLLMQSHFSICRGVSSDSGTHKVEYCNVRIFSMNPSRSSHYSRISPLHTLPSEGEIQVFWA